MAISARNFFFSEKLVPQRRASSSTTKNPALCRVPSYAFPKLPSPTISVVPLAGLDGFDVNNDGGAFKPELIMEAIFEITDIGFL